MFGVVLAVVSLAATALVGVSLQEVRAEARGTVPFASGGVINFGDAGHYGSPTTTTVNAPIVGMASTALRTGLLAHRRRRRRLRLRRRGFHGSAGGIELYDPVIGIAATPYGQGYWQLALDGGVFAYGDALFRGSTGGMRLNKPVVGMTSTPSGQGYWLVASDGGIFAFGDAAFRGSAGGMRLNSPIVGMEATPTGKGYWLVASDGGIFGFGDAAFYGSTGGQALRASIVGMVASPSGGGYTLAGRDGSVYVFGDAVRYGSNAGVVPTPPIVGIERTPSGHGYWLLDNDVFPTSFAHPGAPGGVRASIVAAAAGEVGANPFTGRACNPYGPCEDWCALFATWVWNRAGIPIPNYPFTGSVWAWEAARGKALSPWARPSPGDLVLYGTGPRSASTSVHMGVVAQVWPDGAIVTVEGNAGPGPEGRHDVIIKGPYLPAFSQQYNGFGIYAFATP